MLTNQGPGTSPTQHRRRARLSTAVLFLMAVATSAFAPAARQAVGGPIVIIDEVDSTDYVGFCGFPMEIRQSGKAVIRLWLTDSGEFDQVLITSPETFITFTNLLTGESVWTPSVNMMLQYQTGDNTRQATYRGLLWRLVVPGEGLVTADVGRLDVVLTRDPLTGEVSTSDPTFSAGIQEGQFLPAVCSVLAS